MEGVLEQASDRPGGLEKVKAARDIAAQMNPEKNLLKSFQMFYEVLLNSIASVSCAIAQPDSCPN